MKVIVAVDNNWGIGKDNKLLMEIPEDQKFFREMTLGKIIVIGRRTLEGFPGGMPLEGRTNIVLTSDTSFDINGAIVVHSIPELLVALEDYDSDDVFVAGGGNVYRQLIDKCSNAFVTRINCDRDADTFFPNLDKIPGWRMLKSKTSSYEGVDIKYCEYVKLHWH